MLRVRCRLSRHRKIYILLFSVFVLLSLRSSFRQDTSNSDNVMDKLEVKISAFFRSNISSEKLDAYTRSLEMITTTPYPYNYTGCRPIYNNRTNYHNTSLLTQTECEHKYQLLILVTSNISHFDRRMLIRNTWGNDLTSGSRWKTFFLVGRTEDEINMDVLACESEMFGDIIFGDTSENFFNLTFKVQMGFEWSITYCDFEYLLKADDDVFVNIPNLFKFLQDEDTPKYNLYAGNVHYAAKVFRKGKYAVSKREYWKKIYPRYCSGGGFILSVDVVRKMTKNIFKVNPLKIDDAYIGELALATGIDLIHSDSFRMFESKVKCIYNNTFIVHHPVKNKECMVKMFNSNSALMKKLDGVT